MLETAQNDAENIINKSDTELVALTLANQDYFIYIVDRYKKKLWRYVRRLTNIADEDAEDILQEVFIKIYYNLNDYDIKLPFSSWIYRIAHNQVISNFRKIAVRPQGNQTSLDDQAVQNLISDTDIEKEIDLKIINQQINQALQKLDPKYRELLILKYFEEKNYQEISDITRRPAGTVASLLNRAKKEFKEQYSRSKKTI